MKLFILHRTEDESGVSGTGVVAEGIVFHGGSCALHWLTQVDEKTGFSSIGIYSSMENLEKIHGHNGRTKVVYTNSPNELPKRMEEETT